MKSPIEQYAEVEAMKKVDVMNALDAQIEHTRRFGGAPSFQTMQDVRDIVASLIEASRIVCMKANDGFMPDDDIANMEDILDRIA